MDTDFRIRKEELSEAWQSLDDKQKMEWKNVAQALARKASGRHIDTGIDASCQNKSFKSSTILGTAPINTAAHLKLFGDSLTALGEKIIEYNVSSKSAEKPPPPPSMQPSGPYPGPPGAIGFNVDAPAPSYESVFGVNPAASNSPSTGNISSAPDMPSVTPTPAPRSKFPVDTLPELPSVPNTILPDVGNNDGNNEVDFDDLAKRFEELKKRK